MQKLAQIDWSTISGAIPGLKPVFTAETNESDATKVGEIISLVLPIIFVLAGLLLLFNLISAGLQMMTGANDEKAVAGARARITQALTGFLILFCSYWIVRILETILGIKVL